MSRIEEELKIEAGLRIAAGLRVEKKGSTWDKLFDIRHTKPKG